MGMAIPLAVTTNKPLNKKNIIRVFALFFIGFFLNLFARKFTFNHCKYFLLLYIVRILGILQRISICYGGILLTHFMTSYGEAQKRIYGFVSILACMMLYLSYMLSFSKP
jgi:predicted acyltransferase